MQALQGSGYSMISTKIIIILGLASIPLLVAAEFQNPTDTPFYKRSTGQDDEFTQKEAERQKLESGKTYIRVIQGLSSKLKNENRTDVSDIAKDWKNNAARAQTKYSKPGYYRGVLDQVKMVGVNTAMVMRSSDGIGITVYPFYIQGVWKQKELVDTIGVVDYAARFNGGEKFDMLCAEAHPKELRGCLMFSISDFE
jgi:hypothetical protein